MMAGPMGVAIRKKSRELDTSGFRPGAHDDDIQVDHGPCGVCHHDSATFLTFSRHVGLTTSPQVQAVSLNLE